jgi:NAD(P)-dependent dehydrogenase (short-subunit alcohol dehydrogenase family)
MKLENRAALVFGAASGIGRACAEACAEEGARVMIADVNETGAKETISAIEAGGGTAEFIQTDITDEQAVKRAVQTTVQDLGGLDILIVSAGSGNPDWHAMIDIYLKGPYYANKHALDAMENAGGGVIINVSSIVGVGAYTVGRNATVDATAYSCAKHGLIGLTKTIAVAYAKKNIRANAICPGYIQTGLTRMLYETEDGGMTLLNDMHVPNGRWGQPSEIGKVAAFLASDDASLITGQPIVVDGGIMAAPGYPGIPDQLPGMPE